MTASILPQEAESIESFVRRLSQSSRDNRSEISAEYFTAVGTYNFKVRPSLTQTEILDAYYDWLRRRVNS